MVNGVKMKLIKTEDEQGVMYSLSGDNLPENYVLSKQNCDEIFRVVDLLDGKRFSLREMYAFADYTWKHSPNTHPVYNDSELMKQPTEIEVEIVMRPASLVYKSNLVIEELDSEGCLILKHVV
jgi:hypothetical protein